jgi:hypothetical protein
MRLHRTRRRQGIRSVRILVDKWDIETLIRKQCLDPAEREDADAVRGAFQDLLFELSRDT